LISDNFVIPIDPSMLS